MPERKTVKKAQRAKRSGKSPSTQAGAFVEEEMRHIRSGKHGAKNARQAIAIGLSKARESGVKIPKKAGGKTPTIKSRIAKKKTSSTRSQAGEERMKKQPRRAASHRALSLQAKRAAKKRTAADRHRSAVKAARTRKEHQKAA